MSASMKNNIFFSGIYEIFFLDIRLVKFNELEVSVHTLTLIDNSDFLTRRWFFNFPFVYRSKRAPISCSTDGLLRWTVMVKFIIFLEYHVILMEWYYTGCLFYSLHTLNYHRIKSLNGLFLSLSGILLQRLCIHDYLIWQLEFDCKYDYESSGNHPTFAQFQENI